MARRNRDRDRGEEAEGGLRAPPSRGAWSSGATQARGGTRSSGFADPLSAIGGRFASLDLSAFADAGLARIEPLTTSVAPMGRAGRNARPKPRYKSGIAPLVKMQAKGQPGRALSLQSRKWDTAQAVKAEALTAKAAATRKPVVSQAKPSPKAREERARVNCKPRPASTRNGSGRSREFIPWCR